MARRKLFIPRGYKATPTTFNKTRLINNAGNYLKTKASAGLQRSFGLSKGAADTAVDLGAQVGIAAYRNYYNKKALDRPMTSMPRKYVPSNTSSTALYTEIGNSRVTLKDAARPMATKNIIKYRYNNTDSGTLAPTVVGVYGMQHAFNLAKVQASPSYALSQNAFSIALNTMFGSTAATNNLNYKIQPTGVLERTLFHNMDRVTAVMEIYDLIAARDLSPTGNDPLTRLTEAAKTMFSAGYIGNVVQPTPGSVVSSQDLYVTPNNPNFLKYWRIVNRTRVELIPGKSHEHVFTMGTRYPLTKARLLSSGGVLKGLTHAVLVIIRSMPIRDGSALNEVTLGTPDVIWTRSTSITYIAETSNPSIIDEYNGYSTDIGIQNVKNPASPDIILAGDDTGSGAGNEPNTDTTVDVDV